MISTNKYKSKYRIMEWINIEEKLPLENKRQQSEDVLVYNGMSEMQVGYTLEGFWQDYYGGRNIEKVTHWKPLPEAPK